MVEAGNRSRECIGEVLAIATRWIVLGALWGGILALSGAAWAEEGLRGRGPARSRPPRISNKFREYKKLTRFFFYDDGVLDSQEKAILERLQKRVDGPTNYRRGSGALY